MDWIGLGTVEHPLSSFKRQIVARTSDEFPTAVFHDNPPVAFDRDGQVLRVVEQILPDLGVRDFGWHGRFSEVNHWIGWLVCVARGNGAKVACRITRATKNVNYFRFP